MSVLAEFTKTSLRWREEFLEDADEAAESGPEMAGNCHD